MRRLILIRHAKSDWSNPDLRDYERPLNTRGKKAAPLMGQTIAAKGWCPDCLVSSPAKRARKTAILIAAELGIDKGDVIYQEDIYDARVGDLIDLVKTFPDLPSIALIGHNPGLSELGQWLCSSAPGWLKTCAVLVLDLDIDRWEDLHSACGTILGYTYPKQVLAEQAAE